MAEPITSGTHTGMDPDTYEPQVPTTSTRRAANAFDPENSLTWRVYMATTQREDYDAREAKIAHQLGETYGPSIRDVRQRPSINELLLSFNAFSHKEFLRLSNRLQAAGYASADDPVAIRTAYQYALEDAAQIQRSGNRNLTFDKYIDNLIRMRGMDPSKLGASAKPRKRTTVSTDRSIYELDAGEAKVMMLNTLQQYLGRDPSKTEIQDFMNAVQTRAQDDPTVRRQTTTTQYRPDGTVASSDSRTRTIEDGFTQADADLLALDKAKASPDYAEYQAVSEYFPVLEQLLGSSV